MKYSKSLLLALTLTALTSVSAEGYSNNPISLDNPCVKAGVQAGLAASNRKYFRKSIGAKPQILYYTDKEFYKIINDFSPDEHIGTLEEVLDDEGSCLPAAADILKVMGFELLQDVKKNPNPINPSKPFDVNGYGIREFKRPTSSK